MTHVCVHLSSSVPTYAPHCVCWVCVQCYYLHNSNTWPVTHSLAPAYLTSAFHQLDLRAECVCPQTCCHVSNLQVWHMWFLSPALSFKVQFSWSLPSLYQLCTLQIAIYYWYLKFFSWIFYLCDLSKSLISSVSHVKEGGSQWTFIEKAHET